MKRNILLTVVLIAIALVFSVCGGGTQEQKSTETAAAASGEQVSSQPQGDNEGVAVAKEILETFDKAVAEAAEIAKTKPEPAELKPKLEALYQKYESTMKELNAKYLDLKNKDIALFGAANGYLGENRGKHVFNKDNVLGEYISYYNLNGQQEAVKLLATDIIKMLDIAVQH